MGVPDLMLVLQDTNPRDSKLSKCFKFGGLEVFSKQSIQFPTHVSALPCSLFLPNIPEEPHKEELAENLLINENLVDCCDVLQ